MAAKQMCRLCLCREDTVLYKIHDDASSYTLDISLVLKITKCVGIHVTPRDGLPQYICHRCSYKIDSFFKFKCLCEASDKLLKSDCGKNNKSASPPRKSLRKRKRKLIYNKSPPESSEEEINEFQEEPTLIMINQEDSEPSENLPVDPLAISDNESNSKQQEVMATELPSFPGLADVKITDNFSNVLHPFKYSSQNSFTLSVNNSVETTIHSKSTFDMTLKPKCKPIKQRKRTASKKKLNKGIIDIEPEIIKQRKCYKLFENASKLTKNQVQCPICNQICLLREHKKHMRLHKLSEEKNNYFCWICRKGFSVRYSLRRHMITHTFNKPFKCTKCDRRFSDKSNLIKHERNHNNERPYICNFCDARFADNSYLLKHMRRVHNRHPVKIVVPSVDHECYTKKFIDPIHENFEKNRKEVHIIRNASTRKRKRATNRTTDFNVEVTENVQNILKFEATETFESITDYTNDPISVQDSFSDFHEAIEGSIGEQIEYPTNEAPQELEKPKKMDSGKNRHVCEFCNKYFRNEVNLEYHLLAHFE